MKKKLRSILALLMAILVVAACTACGSGGNGGTASGSSKLQEVLDRGYLIVGTGSTNAPWHFYDDNGNEIEINPGKTNICVVEQGKSIDAE